VVRGLTNTFLDDVARPARGGTGRRSGPSTPRDIPPHNVLARLEEEADPGWAQVAGWVLAAGLPRLLAHLYERRSAPKLGQSEAEASPDLEWPPGRRPSGSSGEGWERAWLDEPVAALRGSTPRAAAGSADWPRLESLLRQFEYDADAAGRPSQVIAWLREQLGLPAAR
jgi:hypothetical protein